MVCNNVFEKRNGILLPKLWEKKCSSDGEKILKFDAEFAKILRSLGQFVQKVKGQNNFWY